MYLHDVTAKKLKKATEAYKTFRPKMQALQDAGELKVSGASTCPMITPACCIKFAVTFYW